MSASVAVCQQVAFHIAQRRAGTTGDALAVAEALLAKERHYPLVITLLECMQNLSSHRLDEHLRPAEIEALLGPRARVCWAAIDEFWTAVAGWRDQPDPSTKSSTDILFIQNEQLRILLWTTNRSLPDHTRVGLADTVRYEHAGGQPIPGYSHIAAALEIAGQTDLACVLLMCSYADQQPGTGRHSPARDSGSIRTERHGIAPAGSRRP